MLTGIGREISPFGLKPNGVPRAALRFALGYLLMPLWGCGIDEPIAREGVP
jgi:hypothetical protein